MIKKAIIPVAGLGTRFLPVTKTVPKELLPIVDKPNLMYIVEEALEAGIEDIIFIAGRNKEAIENFFDISFELEKKLEEANNLSVLEDLIKIREKANFISIRQQKPLGLGHAVYCAKSIVGDEPFAVLLGDELSTGPKKTTQELVENYNNYASSCIAVMEVAKQDVCKYGIVNPEVINKSTCKITGLVEKPDPQDSPSQLAMLGRYTFTANIMKELEDLPPGRGGEIQLTDAMHRLCQKEDMYGITTKAKRYDAGDKFGYLVANVEFALQHPEIKDSFKSYLQKLSKDL